METTGLLAVVFCFRGCYQGFLLLLPRVPFVVDVRLCALTALYGICKLSVKTL